jgi:hypothetical protein
MGRPEHDLAARAAGDRSPDAVSEVRRDQYALTRSRCGTRACDLTRRASWLQTATLLTRHYFARYVRKDLDSVDLIEQAYLHALYWYPIVCGHLPDNYGPGWHAGTVLSWIVDAVGERGERTCLGTTVLPDPGHAGIARAADNALALTGEDPQWVYASMETLREISQSGGIKSRLARLTYEALTHLDADVAWRVAESAPAEAPGSGGEARRLRLGREVLVVADGRGPTRWPSVDWVDLREEATDVLDYRVRWSELPGRRGTLEVTLRPEVTALAHGRIEAVAAETSSAGHKLAVINDLLQDFERSHHWARGARLQFAGLEQTARRVLRRHLGPSLPDWRTAVYAPRVEERPPHPAVNPFLYPDGPQGPWRAAFSPYC